MFILPTAFNNKARNICHGTHAAIHIERLPEGMYLATSSDIQGLIAQGYTIQETIEIARDVAKKLLESQIRKGENNDNEISKRI